ncbi:Protein of unknown function [Natronincola peptidivorans]|uniref:DUF3800 domain-containing protein n=1 Tax=Natronincola peptidivorans TaxID=426128 RepID=A0A1I0E0K1_9FIRM|nr:DUF3800 domain-containing protein [Natronincola peptidivorans]SET38400.1 Protein of unknown function [Natronincola peptidivorans]
MEYTLYFDESDKQGKYFGNFYGGALVSSKYIDRIVKDLNDKKQELGFLHEIKWSKVSEQYLDKYIEIMTFFFQYIKKNEIKIRIMFTQNCREANNLTKEQRENEFFLLYYQFCKHAFGFQYCNPSNEKIVLKMYFDKLPDTKEKNGKFKEYVYALQYQDVFMENNIFIRREDITEVTSHDHVILQCMDIVLGSIQFKLNDKHKEKPEGKRTRGKKTIAKEKLYKHINKLIREVYPNFNVGASTGVGGDYGNRWNHPYRHWLFTPNEYQYDGTKTKNFKTKLKPHLSY